MLENEKEIQTVEKLAAEVADRAVYLGRGHNFAKHVLFLIDLFSTGSIDINGKIYELSLSQQEAINRLGYLKSFLSIDKYNRVEQTPDVEMFEAEVCRWIDADGASVPRVNLEARIMPDTMRDNLYEIAFEDLRGMDIINSRFYDNEGKFKRHN